MTLSHWFYIAATFFGIIFSILLTTEEEKFAGLVTFAWFGVSFVLFVVAHYITDLAKR